MVLQMIIDKVRNTIEKYDMAAEGAHVIIGLSGGPDSVCLFDLLCGIRGITLYAVHVNHMLRPGACDEDAEYVRKLCKGRDVCCRVFEYDCARIAEENGITSEEAGRRARYEAFGKVAEELSDSGIPREKIRIAVAHNFNDQAETLLLRLIRGTGTDGLCGMDHVRRNENGIMVIRPLLDVRRDEIEDYCREHGLSPRIDETNLRPLYSRNRVRLDLIPFIDREFGGDITRALFRLSENAGEDSDYLNKTAGRVLENAEIMKERVILSYDDISELHNAILKRVIAGGFSEIGLVQDITKKQLDAAVEIIHKRRTSGAVDFPHGYRLKIGYEEVILEKTGVKPCVKYGERTVELDWNRLCNEYIRNTGRKPEKSEIVQRTRMPGDYIVFGKGPEHHRKKLKKLFVDEKVPEEYRDSIPLFAIGNEVLWTAGCGGMKERTNVKYMTGPDTVERIRLTLKEDK